MTSHFLYISRHDITTQRFVEVTVRQSPIYPRISLVTVFMKADDYTLPSFRTTDVSADSGLFLADVAVDSIVAVIGDDGDIVGEVDGFIMYFWSIDIPLDLLVN